MYERPTPSETMRSVQVVLGDAHDQITEAKQIIRATANEEEVHPLLLARIKCALEGQRSALDYLAFGIVRRHGDKAAPQHQIRYPMARKAQDFDDAFERNMPGVVRDDIRGAVGAHQPFNQEWLKNLGLLANKNKHRHLSKLNRWQLRLEGDEVRDHQGYMWAGNHRGNSPRPTDIVGAVEPEEPLPSGVNMFFVDWSFDNVPLDPLSAEMPAGTPVGWTLDHIQDEVLMTANVLAHVCRLWE
jgi:hypothetical protein